MQNDPRFEINENANLALIGEIVTDALIDYEEGDECFLVRERLLKIHTMIYPNASRPATAEENAVIATTEPLSACKLKSIPRHHDNKLTMLK